MPCVQVGPALVLMADNRWLRKRYLRCPSCQCITEMVVRFEAWYGDTTYCCRCGDWWQDGEMCPRPFQRGWRKKAIAKHRELWDRATFGPNPTLQELYPEYDEDYWDEERELVTAQPIVDVHLPDPEVP